MKPPTVLIGPKNTRFGEITVVEETGSTNTDLLSEPPNADGSPKVLVTKHQTLGRGRDGRTWLDNPGESLLISVMAEFSPQVAQLMPFVAGLAIASFAQELGCPDVGLKWPNDVLINNQKLAGILVEARSRDGLLKTVVGCGINLLEPQHQEAHERAISLEGATGKACTIPQAANYYLRHLEDQLYRVETDGAEDLLMRYSQVCMTLGREVTALFEGSEVVGKADSLGGRGELLIRTDSGDIVTIDYGDVHLV